jgi:hypothetical protein
MNNVTDSTSGPVYLRKRTPKKSFDYSENRKSSIDSEAEPPKGEEDIDEEEDNSNRKKLLKMMLELFEGKNVTEEQLKPLNSDER